MHHFGEALVLSPSDFGIRSEPPSHPELLDWLAAELIANGWSTKDLHRQIVLSSTYRQQRVYHAKLISGINKNVRLAIEWQDGSQLAFQQRETTPPWNGATIVTNQAFAPHEMLYPHEYRSMYGPFYYRVKGSWIWTPFGMESHDKWELTGTEVRVKYRSNYHLLSGFIPPVLR